MNRKILISPYGRALGVFTLFALMMINSSAALADEVTIGMSKEVAYILNSFMFLMCGVLVMWMAAGFAMLEAGFVRIHNTSVICLKNVALFATPATVRSRAFQRELAFRAIGVDVEAQACGGVVDAIEDGDMILAEALVRSHVDALKRKMPEPDAAILGCTHYPLMEEIFQDALGDNVRVFSQASLVAESLADYLERRPEMVGPGTESLFLTTGDPRNVSNRATQFLRRKIEFIHRVIEPYEIAANG